MGQETAISFGLLTISGIIIGSILFSVIMSNQELTASVQDAAAERAFIRSHTSVALSNVSLDSTQLELSILVENTGTETIYDLSKLDILTNASNGIDCGSYATAYWIPPAALGTPILDAECYWTYDLLNNTWDPQFWNPSELLNITVHFNVTRPIGSYWVCVSTPNAVQASGIYAVGII